MTNTYGLVARWALALSVSSRVLCGCKGNAQPQAPPPPEVSVIEVKPGPVTVYNEYVAQTQAPDTIEIRSQVTGLLERQVFADGARSRRVTCSMSSISGPSRPSSRRPKRAWPRPRRIWSMPSRIWRGTPA